MKYPYVDIARQHRPLKDELMEAIGRVLDHGVFVSGDEVEEFERAFARMCSTRYAVAVNSGTDALILSLRGLGIGPGDEVVTVPNSFTATTSAIRMVQAEPVFVDVRDDLNMDPGEIEKAINSNTRAILPVHLTGRPAEMDGIIEIARKYDLALIEDCAQAVLAEYRGNRVGSFGAAGCFSLHPLKNLGACGDGGIVTTNDRDLCEKLRTLRNIGHQNRDEAVCWSGNSRLDTLQAAILLVKMNYLEEWTEKRRKNAAQYRRELADVPEIETPFERSCEKAVYHTFVIQAERRDQLKDYLAERGIGTAIHYPIPLHLQPVFVDTGYRCGSFPVAEGLADKILSLPIYQDLEARGIHFIADQIKAFYQVD